MFAIESRVVSSVLFVVSRVSYRVQRAAATLCELGARRPRRVDERHEHGRDRLARRRHDLQRRGRQATAGQFGARQRADWFVAFSGVVHGQFERKPRPVCMQSVNHVTCVLAHGRREQCTCLWQASRVAPPGARGGGRRGAFDEDEDPCSICHEEMRPGSTKMLQCFHYFHDKVRFFVVQCVCVCVCVCVLRSPIFGPKPRWSIPLWCERHNSDAPRPGSLNQQIHAHSALKHARAQCRFQRGVHLECDVRHDAPSA